MKINTILLSAILVLMVWMHIGESFGDAIEDYQDYKRLNREGKKFQYYKDDGLAQCDIGFRATFSLYSLRFNSYTYPVDGTCVVKAIK